MKIVLLAIGFAAMDALGATETDFASRRRAMVAEITAEHPGLPGRFSAQVKEAMARVPRHLFVPQAQQPHAYENRPLPIGHAQSTRLSTRLW